MGGNLNGPGILYIFMSGEPGEPVETENTHFARDRHVQNTRNYETICRFSGCSGTSILLGKRNLQSFLREDVIRGGVMIEV
jgi:hypothetical protein